MAYLDKARALTFKGAQDEISPRVAASETYFAGGILVYNRGFAALPSNGANLEVAGVVTGTYDDGDRVDEKVCGAGETPRANLKRGKVWIPVAGSRQTDVGEIHYVVDDSTLSKTASSKTVGYRALDYRDGSLLFDFRAPDRIK